MQNPPMIRQCKVYRYHSNTLSHNEHWEHLISHCQKQETTRVTSVSWNNFFGTSDVDTFNTGSNLICGGSRFSI